MTTINTTLASIFPSSGPGLEYGACFLTTLIQKAQIKNTAALITYEAEETDSTIALLDPTIFYGLAHGSPCNFGNYIQTAWEGNFYDIIEGTIHTRCFKNVRLELMKNRHVHLLSCLTGKALGPALIKAGARSYIGYSEEFVFGVYRQSLPAPCSQPTLNADFYSFIDSDVEAERKIILEGSSVRRAVEAMRNKFQEYIDKYEVGEWKDRPIAHEASTWLRWDLNALTVLGTLDWRPLSQTIAPRILSPTLIPLSLGLSMPIYLATR